jgi:hypothetical protein
MTVVCRSHLVQTYDFFGTFDSSPSPIANALIMRVKFFAAALGIASRATSLFIFSYLWIGGEGGIRTHVPVTRQDAFEAPPLRPLRYLSGRVRAVRLKRIQAR